MRLVFETVAFGLVLLSLVSALVVMGVDSL